MLDHLRQANDHVAMNCGYGRGYSVREVLAVINQLCGGSLALRDAARRIGDPPTLVADSNLIRNTLNWSPRFDDLRVICESALTWSKRVRS
jgi:UDP-glucose 4-epimerase